MTWVDALKIVDEDRGRFGKIYKRNDVQRQLRMLTEKIGLWGYLLGDGHDCRVSTYASELRVFRNRMGHNDEFSLTEAWRFHYTCVRLFDVLGESEGKSESSALADRALNMILAKKQPVPQPRVVSEEVCQAHQAEQASEDEKVVPPAVAMQKNQAEKAKAPARTFSLLEDGGRYVFETMEIIPMGEPDVFESMRRKSNVEQLRSGIAEIVAIEGPIHMDRLTRLVVNCFGLSRVTTKTQRQIAHQVSKVEELTVDDDKFVWPSDIDPQSWSDFRPNGSDVNRNFEHISPVEIANAWMHLAQVQREAGEPDDEASVIDLVVQTFGKKRKTAAVKKHVK